MLIRPLKSLIQDAAEIFPSQVVQWPKAVVYSNFDHILDEATRNSFRKADNLVQFRVSGVSIGRYPSGATLLGADSFWVLVGETLIREQIAVSTRLLPIFAPNPAATLQVIRSAVTETLDIEEECVLLARYGWGTWGHWLNEILPKAVIAESFFPGRFRYVVPASIGQQPTKRNFASAMGESLRAYGISEEREIRVEPNKNYRFRSLFDLGGGIMWARSGAIVHPAVSSLMRERLPEIAPSVGSPLLAIERHGAIRSLQNTQQVDVELVARGFKFIDPMALTFRDQVAYFRGAVVVFSVYGSGLANILYSPMGIRVLTCGPTHWGDTYFMYTVKERHGWYADVRGPHVWNGVGHLFHAPFFVDPVQIVTALEHLCAIESGMALES